MKVRCLLVCAAASGMVFPTQGASSPSQGLDTQGGEYRLTRPLRGDQVHPRAALGAKGGYLVWQDNVTDGDGFGISAVQVDAGLNADLEPFRVNTTAAGDQEKPDVALLDNGSTLLVWQSGDTIRGRLLKADGTFTSDTDFIVNTHRGTPKGDAAAAPVAGGGALVIWASYGQDDSGSEEAAGGYRNLQGIFGQRLTATGEKLGGEFQLNQYVRFNQRNPALTRLASGKLVVVWVSERGTINTQDGQTTDDVQGVDVYGRFLTESGEPAGDEFLISDPKILASSPSVTASGDGFAVAWAQRSRESRETATEVMARFFGSAGSATSAPIVVNSHWFGDQFAPSVASAGGSVAVVWTSFGQDGSREGVYGQYLSAGAKVGGEFRVNTTTASRQLYPRIVARANDGFLAFWSTFAGSPNDFEIYGQRYSMTLPPAPQPVASALNANRIALAWPPVGGYDNLEYLVYVDGSSTPNVTQDFYWNSSAAFQPGSTHSFRLAFRLPGGAVSPVSQSVEATTWGADENFDGLPDDWQARYWGVNTDAWPAPNDDSDQDGMKNRDEFLAGTDPSKASSLLRSQVSHSSQGTVLKWNTVPGLVYQIEESADLKSWRSVGSPRFARSSSDQAPVEKTGALRYYRVKRIR